jgi:hypothetical protein
LAIFIAALIVASALGGAVAKIVSELKRAEDERRRARQLSIAALFAPGMASAHDDPRVLLTWQPLAKTLRALFATEFSALDTASGSTFPFNKDVLASAHARWTADWLAWERAHDATYKLKALTARHELQAEASSDVGRAKLDAIEREKLELYQRRYEEYVRVGKALHALLS